MMGKRVVCSGAFRQRPSWIQMLSIPVTRKAHSPGDPRGPQGALRSLQPSTLQVPEGGGEGDGTDLTGDKHPCTAPCGETSALGKEEDSGLGGEGGQSPYPLPLQPEAQGQWVGGGRLHRWFA